MGKTKKDRIAAALFVLAALTASVALAQQPRGWSQGLQESEVLRLQYFTAPYDGWYCVRVVEDDGSVRGWRQEDRRRTQIVSGTIGLPGLLTLQAGLAVIGPAAPPPPETADGHTRLRMVFRTPAGVGRREYAGPIPGPVREVVNLVNGALPGSGGCTI